VNAKLKGEVEATIAPCLFSTGGEGGILMTSGHYCRRRKEWSFASSKKLILLRSFNLNKLLSQLVFADSSLAAKVDNMHYILSYCYITSIDFLRISIYIIVLFLAENTVLFLKHSY